MPSLPEPRVIVTTFAKEEQAIEVIRALVRERLVACGTLTRRSRSIYVWQGQLTDSDEIAVMFKTTVEAAPAAATRLKELHPYEVPEILVFAPDFADAAYAQWIADACASQ